VGRRHLPVAIGYDRIFMHILLYTLKISTNKLETHLPIGLGFQLNQNSNHTKQILYYNTHNYPNVASYTSSWRSNSPFTLSPLRWVRRSFTVQPAVKNDRSLRRSTAAGIPSRPRATCPTFVHCCDLLFQNGRSSACVVSVLAR